MNFIKIAESDNSVVKYDEVSGIYMVSIFEDGRCKYEVWFDAYEEKELPETNYCNCKTTKYKDEYWGHWIECECGYKSNVDGAKYCGGCGKKIRVIGATAEFEHFGER